MRVEFPTILVLATCNILGMHEGEEHEVYPSSRVEKLLAAGYLVWLDEPDDGGE